MCGVFFSVKVDDRCLPALLCLAPVHLSVPLLVPWNQHQLVSVVQAVRVEDKQNGGRERERETKTEGKRGSVLGENILRAKTDELQRVKK